MEFLNSLSALLKTSFILSYVIVILSLPVLLKRVWFGLKKEKFSCRMCGNCCRFNIIAMTEEDVKRIKEAGFKDFVENSGEKKLRRVRGRCVFSRDDKCGIYEIRPSVCREFPFQKIFGVIPYMRDWSCCPAISEFKKSFGRKDGRHRKAREVDRVD